MQKQKESLSVSMAKLAMVASLILWIGSIVGIMGYFWTMPKNEIAINNEIKKEEVNKDEIIKNENADWKAYRNEEYGFEMKYPSNLISDNKIVSDPYPIYLLLWNKEMHNKFEKGEITQPYLWITSEPLEDLYLEKWIESRETDISEKEYITFGDIKFLRVYEQGYANGTYLFYIAKEGAVFTIGTSTNKTDSVFNQILSTFKFIE